MKIYGAYLKSGKELSDMDNVSYYDLGNTGAIERAHLSAGLLGIL